MSTLENVIYFPVTNIQGGWSVINIDVAFVLNSEKSDAASMMHNKIYVYIIK